LSDNRPGLVLALGGPFLLCGWIALAMLGAHVVLLLALVLIQGTLAFGVGSTLIARVLYAAQGAPTMGGSYATAALNIGAAAGPVLGGIGLLSGMGTVAPVWIAAALTALALIIMLSAGRSLMSHFVESRQLQPTESR
ncbi:MAG TPA: Cmx/CmrA family chloramphenicol efflux MFS transporter, partial [Candidatus Microbacterium pullistercoris]|nr:Cmx/CmrA family chloramphenicol efflux MFS transporter [Candidatus Microbacterium pullistercoris]